MRSRLQKAIDYIKGYCDKHDSCYTCRLQNKEDAACMLKSTYPGEWELKKDQRQVQRELGKRK